jgi:glycosyltransferase 2 family protein
MSEPPVTPTTASAASAATPASARDAHGRVPPPGDGEVTQDQVSLGRRLRQPRTILSIAIPLILLLLASQLFLKIDFGLVLASVAQANKLLLLAAFLVFYAGFPLRGLRWRLILRGTKVNIDLRDSTEIIGLSWLVNCLVPAKLGDIYRAYLLKINAPVSLSRTFGTVFIERILDLFAIATLGLLAGFWSFRSGLPPEIQFVAVLGIAVMVILGLALLTLRNFGRRIIEALPLPHRVLELYDRFEEGVFGAVSGRTLPGLIGLTGIIWCTEGLRLWLVIQALGFPDANLGISGAFFVALIGSLLTAVPLSPAGLGLVEAGMVGILVAAYGLPVQEATTIAIVDRVISVFSVILFGSILYVVSPIRRGKGLHEPVDLPAAAAAA